MARRHEHEIEALVRAHYAEVWRFCGSLVDRESADDLTQDTFMRAGRGLRDFRGDSTVLTWLLGIARRICADEIRARSRRSRRDQRLIGRPRSSSPGTPGPGASVEMRDLVDRLDPERRAAFVLTQLIGLSYAEAAAVCECPIGTIRSRVARARDELLSALQNAPDELADSRG